ncbi:MAG: response regulator [Thiomargarita sp.]|nr:response regulator [Thiomargarita sp.]
MTKKATLLFVDDEPMILKTLEILFKSHYHVYTASSGEAALNIIENETVHAIISDQRMPNMCGTTLLEHVKKISPHTLRLLLTGYSESDKMISAVNEAEIFRYMTKPWDFDEIQTRVSQAVKISQNIKHCPAQEHLTSINNEILVIDDEVDTYNMLSHQYDSSVTRTSTLASACEHMTHQDNLTVVISDMTVNGDDMIIPLKALKLARPDIVTIIVTQVQDAQLLMGLINQAQIFRFLQKPINNQILDTAVQAAIQHYLQMQQRPELLACHAIEIPRHSTEFNTFKKIFEKK